MSKKTWISLVLDETIPDQTIFELIRGSRSLVVPKHLRKASEPHYWIVPVNLKYYDIGRSSQQVRIFFGLRKPVCKKGTSLQSILRHLPRPSVISVRF
ncbi:MAG: hypothetical protein ACLU4Q_07550 [Streptococcus thermophilus]